MCELEQLSQLSQTTDALRAAFNARMTHLSLRKKGKSDQREINEWTWLLYDFDKGKTCCAREHYHNNFIFESLTLRILINHLLTKLPNYPTVVN